MTVEKKIKSFEQMAVQAAQVKKRQVTEEMESRFNSSVEESVREESVKWQGVIRVKRYETERTQNQKIVEASGRAKRDFINERSRLTEALFDGVIKKLRDFTESPEYEKYLTEAVVNAAEKGRYAFVQLTGADMRYSAAVNTAAGVEAEESKDDFIGGFRLVSADRRVINDQTFKTRLNGQRENFSLMIDAARKGVNP